MKLRHSFEELPHMAVIIMCKMTSRSV